MIKNFIVFILLASMSACGRISIYKYKAHDITGESDIKMAMLYVPRDIYVKEIDGKGSYSPNGSSDLFPYSAAEIELAPGTHTLSLSYASSLGYTKSKTNITHIFVPGGSYFLDSKVNYAKSESGNTLKSVSYVVNKCGSREEEEINKSNKKHAGWLAPYVPVCGK